MLDVVLLFAIFISLISVADFFALNRLFHRHSAIRVLKFDPLSLPDKYEPCYNELVEDVTAIQKGTPIEIVHKQKLHFGNYEKDRSATSMEVVLSTGENIVIDVSQLISCWLFDEEITPPCSIEDWKNVELEAQALFKDIIPRKQELRDFWKTISVRSRAFPTDSLDLGVYLFHEDSLLPWVDPFHPTELFLSRPITPAERFISAKMLFEDDFHFKRRPSRISKDFVPNNDSFNPFLENQIETNEIGVVEGGYEVLEDSVALFREGAVFESFYRDVVHNQTQTSSSVPLFNSSNRVLKDTYLSQQLRAMEYYSLAPTNIRAPVLVRHILGRLGKRVTPESAREILVAIKHHSSPSSVKELLGIQDHPGHSRTPWPEDVLKDAQDLATQAEEIREELIDPDTFVRPGKRGHLGRMDYRRSSILNPPICVDSRRASFRDDAFSLFPEKSEIIIHVADIMSLLRSYPRLRDVAKERLMSLFLPSGPIHMLPPTALEALKLSSRTPNKVLSIAVKVNFTTGEIEGSRIFPSLIGPVFAMDIATANNVLAQSQLLNSTEVSDRYSYPLSVINDINVIHDVVMKIIHRYPWVEAHFNLSSRKSFKLDKKLGLYSVDTIEVTPATRMLNALLTLYSNYSCSYCNSKGIPVPIVWENRDRTETSSVRRFGTQPLRNWISQLQQQQIRGALRMDLYIKRKECAAAVLHHNDVKQRLDTFHSEHKDLMSFESFYNYCNNMMEHSDEYPVVPAIGLGDTPGSGRVKLVDFSVQGVCLQEVPKNQQVYVKVSKIDNSTRSITFDIVDIFV